MSVIFLFLATLQTSNMYLILGSNFIFSQANFDHAYAHIHLKAKHFKTYIKLRMILF